MPETIDTTQTAENELRAKILTFNELAQEADTRMREALDRGDSSAAYFYRQRRDQYNQQAKRLLASLGRDTAPETETRQIPTDRPIWEKEQLKREIRELNSKAQAADEKMRKALQASNSALAQEWRNKRDQYNAQAKKFQDLLKAVPGEGNEEPGDNDNRTPVPEPQAPDYSQLSRNQLKQKLTELNSKALQADTLMRQALSNGNQSQATALQQQRDAYNQQARQILALLNQKTSQPQPPPQRTLSAEEQRRVKILRTEIQRDQRILEQHRANGNQPGIAKYENIRKAQDAELNRLLSGGSTPDSGQSSPGTGTGQGLTPEEATRLSRLPFHIRFAEKRIAAGDQRYHSILQNLRAELARLEAKKAQGPSTARPQPKPPPGGNDGGGNSSGSSGNKPLPPDVKGLCDVKRIATDHYINSKHYIHSDDAHNAIIRCLLGRARYGFSPGYIQNMLKDINGQRFIIRTQQDVADLHRQLPRNANGLHVVGNFIRDAFKLNLDTTDTEPLFLSNFDISDDISDSEFVRHFDSVVNDINNYLDAVGSNKKSLGHFSHVGHRDAIQVIPMQNDNLGRKDHFLGARIQRPIVISGNRITSRNQLQGIFASDGCFQNLQLINNKIKINGAHTISFNGVLSGKVAGNTDLDGNALTYPQLKLLPLRLGGWSNVYVTSFHPSSAWQYSSSDIPPEIDFRQAPSSATKRGHATFFRNFYMEKFFEEFRKVINNSTDLALAAQRKEADRIQKNSNPRHFVGPDLYYHIHLAVERLVNQNHAQPDNR